MKNKKYFDSDEKFKEGMIERFCKHLRKGLSEYSFVECDYRDIEKIATELDTRENMESQVEKIKKALRESFSYWEKLAFEILKDDSKKFFFPIWIFYVKNRFHWGEDYKKVKDTIKKDSIINLNLDNDIKEIEKQVK
jgi:hypothetical protein